MVLTHASLPLPLSNLRAYSYLHRIMIDHKKCPLCNAPTVIREMPEHSKDEIFHPYEIVLTCTGIHKGKQLDIADWYDQENNKKDYNENIGIRETSKRLAKDV